MLVNHRFVVRSPLVSVQVWLAVAETTLDILVLVVKPLVSNLGHIQIKVK